jgi:uncharacterized protein (TIGR03437 family)
MFMLLRYWILFVIAVVSPAQTFTTLASFNGTNGNEPLGPVVQGADGNFYGTTELGGANNLGTIFKISAGTLSTVYSFGGSGGCGCSSPTAGLIQATDGNLYGTTSGDSTIFKITSAGTFTALYKVASTSDGGGLQAGLIQATDGNFYGTASTGGSGYGTIFKVTPGGVFTVLHTFAGTDGSAPVAGLVQGTDGNFYGTTSAGGASNDGTVFKITPGGTLTTLYSFAGTDGEDPHGGLVEGSDGNFYGTTVSGPGGAGTIFKITPAGTLTTLHAFSTSTDKGWGPFGGLIQATDGSFYGTAYYGDSTVFKITPAGALTPLYVFDSAKPAAGVIEGADGNLYGTTQYGGANSDGSVFELQTMLPVATGPSITLIQNAEGGASTVAPNTWVTLKGSNLAPAGDSRIWMASDFVNGQLPTALDGVSVTVNGAAAYVYYISPTQVNVLTARGALSGSVEVVLTNGTASAPFSVQTQAESPSFFVFNGGPYIAATHLNGSLIGPTTLYPGYSTPAAPGETIVLYANGFGATSVPVIAGAETQSGTLTPLPVVTVGLVNATVLFAGLVAPGEFQFNIVLPSSLSSADQPVTATYNGLTTQAGTLITVQ